MAMEQGPGRWFANNRMVSELPTNQEWSRGVRIS